MSASLHMITAPRGCPRAATACARPLPMKLRSTFGIMLRKLVSCVKYFGRRRTRILVVPLAVVACLAWWSSWRGAWLAGEALLPPSPPAHDLHHLRRNRSLAHYMDNIQLLIEPSSTPCANLQEIPVIVLVSSAPWRHQQRAAVRRSWAAHQPTYFLLGQHATDAEEWLADNYIEAKQYGDMVVYDFLDHYQNLTLKVALMMHWTLGRCPHAHFMMKTDDDVMLNPWALQTVLRENADAKLLGYKFEGATLHRDAYSKWYLPRWLCAQDRIPEYLTGPAYLISGEYLHKILKEAHNVPLINLEDVYFTYLVAKKTLRLSLTHDSRLSPYKPWLVLKCAYWALASIHSLDPDEMVTAWMRIEELRKENITEDTCSFFNRYLASDYLLY